MSDERDYCILGDAWAQLIREYRRKPIDSLRRSLDVRWAVASYTHRRHPNAPDPSLITHGGRADAMLVTTTARRQRRAGAAASAPGTARVMTWQIIFNNSPGGRTLTASSTTA